MSDPVLLTPLEAAKRLHISDKTLRRIRQQGHIRYVAIELGAGGFIPHDPDWTLTNAYGDCKDQAVLFAQPLGGEHAGRVRALEQPLTAAKCRSSGRCST